MLKILPFFILLGFGFCGQGQDCERDSSRCALPSALKEQILPAGLLTASVALNIGNAKKSIQDYFPDTDTRIDNQLKYTPSVLLYTFDLLGFKHRNNILCQTTYLLASQAAAGAIVKVTKKVTDIRRPEGGTRSYPSGHTSNAFVGATVLFLEFRESEPLLAYSGFVLASATGILRITNDAHWLPDVMAGAAIGMGITTLVYRLDPLKKITLLRKNKELSFVPGIGDQGLNLKILF